MKFGPFAIALFAGVLNPFLDGMSSTLGKTISQPVWTVAATFAVAMSTTLIVAFATNQLFPSMDGIDQAPRWSWLGGLFVAGFVLTLVADKLGASVFTAVTATVAMIVAVVLDHYGVVGFLVHRINLLRIAGSVVMTGGLGLCCMDRKTGMEHLPLATATSAGRTPAVKQGWASPRPAPGPAFLKC